MHLPTRSRKAALEDRKSDCSVLPEANYPDFWYCWFMQATKEQLDSLGNYRDIILQQASKVATGIGVPQETLQGWTEGKGEPTSEQPIVLVLMLVLSLAGA